MDILLAVLECIASIFILNVHKDIDELHKKYQLRINRNLFLLIVITTSLILLLLASILVFNIISYLL